MHVAFSKPLYGAQLVKQSSNLCGYPLNRTKSGPSRESNKNLKVRQRYATNP